VESSENLKKRAVKSMQYFIREVEEAKKVSQYDVDVVEEKLTKYTHYGHYEKPTGERTVTITLRFKEGD